MSDFVNAGFFTEKFLDVTVSCAIADGRYVVIEQEPINSEIFIPLSIFKNKSCGKTLVSYLKSKGLSFSDIARILNRNPRTVWTLLKNSSEESYFDDADIMVPAEIFSYRGFSLLESIVFYLRNEKEMSHVQISKSLGKNYQTIRTVYLRALKKIETNEASSIHE